MKSVFIVTFMSCYVCSGDGTTDEPCTDFYGGPVPASEPETIIIQNELIRLGPILTGAVSVHTDAQMWLHPFGYRDNRTCARTQDHEDLVGLRSHAIYYDI